LDESRSDEDVPGTGQAMLSTPPNPCLSCALVPTTFVRNDRDCFEDPDEEQGRERGHREWVKVFPGDPAADYLLVIQDDGHPRTSAIVLLNGRVILLPKALRASGVNEIRMSVTLKKSNRLRVVPLGKRGAKVTVWVLGGAKEIGPAGGRVSEPGGGLSVSIPAGALPSLTVISVSPAPATRPAPFGSGEGMIAWDLEPSGTVFQSPVTVTIPYVKFLHILGSGASVEDVAIIHSDPGGGFSDFVGTTHDPAAAAIAVPLEHFSRLTLLVSQDRRWATWNLKWTAPVITWYIRPTTSPSYLTDALVQSLIAQWTSEAGSLAFAKSTTEASANVVFVETGSTQPWLAAIGCLFGANALIGHTCFPFSAQNWRTTLTSTDRVSVRIASGLIESEAVARHVILHEIGHALGIAHNPTRFWAGFADAPVMNQGEFYPSTLRPEDIAALRSLYGAPSATRQYVDYCYYPTMNGSEPVTACATAEMSSTEIPGGKTKVTVKIRNLQGSHPADDAGWSFVSAVRVYFPHGSDAGELESVTLRTEGSVFAYGPSAPEVPAFAWWTPFGVPVTYPGGTFGGLYNIGIAGAGPADRAALYGCGGRDRFEEGATLGVIVGGLKTCEPEGLDGWLVIEFVATGTAWSSGAELSWQIYTGSASSTEPCLPMLGTCSARPR